MSGTVDNLSEVALELGLANAEAVNPFEILITAYLRWDVDFLPRILGEFALILWDQRQRCLVAARDALGCEELFYRADEHGVLVASQIWQLLHPEELSTTSLDATFLSDFLLWHRPPQQTTAFRQIHRIPAGHFLRADGRSWSIHPYWDLSDRPSATRLSKEESVEAFRHLFERAVETCGNSDSETCWAELSGGIDSSSIVAMAQHLKSKGRFPSSLETLTLTFPETYASDESEWARKVVSPVGPSNHFLPSDRQFWLGAERDAFFRNDPHFGMFCSRFLAAEASYMAERGAHLVLSGARAESVLLDIMPPPLHLYVLLRRGQWWSALRAARSWSRRRGSSLPNTLSKGVVQPFLSQLIQRPLIPEFSGTAEWLSERVLRDLSPYTHKEAARFDLPEVRYHYDLIKSSESFMNRGALNHRLLIRHPFLYRPFVEFCFHLGWHLKAHPVFSKILLRRAMKGLLPKDVLLRWDSKSPTEAALSCLPQHWATISRWLESSVLADLGILRFESWRRHWSAARHGKVDRFVQLSSALALDVWLQAMLSSPPEEFSPTRLLNRWTASTGFASSEEVDLFSKSRP